MYGPTEGQVRVIATLAAVGAVAIVAGGVAAIGWLVVTLLKGMGVLPV